MNDRNNENRQKVPTRPATKADGGDLGGIMPDVLQRESGRPRTAYDTARVRRRKPKRHRFLIAMLIYVAAAILVIGTLTCIGWKYVGLRAEASADTFVNDLVINTNEEGWRQLLLQQFPNTYSGCEDGEKLAEEILAPNFKVGKVTWLRYIPTGRVVADNSKYSYNADPDAVHGIKIDDELPTYSLFSDGELFAMITLSDENKGLLGLGEWKIAGILFSLDYFGDEVDFPVTRVTLPENAELTINGKKNSGGAVTSGVGYPAITPAEAHSGPACKNVVLEDLYYVPELTASLDGVELELCRNDEERAYYFKFPQSHTHSVTVTVPESVTARLGGEILTEEWAEKSTVEGELGNLDDGGTGTRPILNVWKVSGIFGTPEVTAEVYGKQLTLLSSEDGNYVFEIPAECKYTVTIIVPQGAAVKVNGRDVEETAKDPAGVTAEELGHGSTALGKYQVSELSALPDIIPNFDKYVLTGYLAIPNVTATLNGKEIEACGMTAREYDLLWEYDYNAVGEFDEKRIEDAKSFTGEYIKYLCDGGAWENPENQKTFDANYKALKDRMIPGTTGYNGVMESYRTVNKMPHYDQYTVDKMETGEYVVYSEGCVSCRVTYSVTRQRTVNGEGVTDILEGSMKVLQVRYKNEWRVWGFISE